MQIKAIHILDYSKYQVKENTASYVLIKSDTLAYEYDMDCRYIPV
jgi:hypothetical protein